MFSSRSRGNELLILDLWGIDDIPRFFVKGICFAAVLRSSDATEMMAESFTVKSLVIGSACRWLLRNGGSSQNDSPAM